MSSRQGAAAAASGSRDVEVAIVGGGPAGAALAIRLAEQGCETVLFERQPSQRWRASGVYSSPLSRRRLARLGLAEHDLARLIQPIRATLIETADESAACVVEHRPEPACGVDRVRLEEALLERAREAGTQVREGAAVLRVELTGGRRQRLLVSQAGNTQAWSARLVVGADGPSSTVARAAGVTRPMRQLRRAAVTGHRAAATSHGGATTARIVIGRGWYLGIAPVPGGRVNLGLVISEHDLRRQLAGGYGLQGVMDDALSRFPDGREWQRAQASDELTVRLPLAHSVNRAGGHGFMLVGDAAGFIDPLSGEGLHRALVCAELAAPATAAWLAGDRLALAEYDRRLRARFRSKDVVSWLLQLFLFRPALAGYALVRLQRRDDLRERFALTLADRAPGSTLADPRFLVRLLAP